MALLAVWYPSEEIKALSLKVYLRNSVRFQVTVTILMKNKTLPKAAEPLAQQPAPDRGEHGRCRGWAAHGVGWLFIWRNSLQRVEKRISDCKALNFHPHSSYPVCLSVFASVWRGPHGFHNEWIPHARAYTRVPTNQPSNLKPTDTYCVCVYL